MNSMTGFGRATVSLGNAAVVVQVNSVNRKTLDLTVRLPESWTPLETKIAEKVKTVASRGKVHLQVGLEAAGGGDSQASLALERLAAVAAENGVEYKPDAGLLWEILTNRRTLAEPELTPEVERAVLTATGEALSGLAAMRGREGAALLVDFTARANALKSSVEAVAARAPQVAPAYREVLSKRLRDAGLELDVDDERVLRELALFADRCDITEEITRLRSHLDQLESHLQGEGEIGRKAEFILQEVGREIHTIGSKANDLEIAKHVIELKNELERIREQVANVE